MGFFMCFTMLYIWGFLYKNQPITLINLVIDRTKGLDGEGGLLLHIDPKLFMKLDKSLS
jgi:hypothetical protein